jgi:hypothetical protein
VRVVPRPVVHLKIAVVFDVTDGGVVVSVAPVRAAAAEVSRRMTPVAPTKAARTRTFRRTGSRP